MFRTDPQSSRHSDGGVHHARRVLAMAITRDHAELPYTTLLAAQRTFFRVSLRHLEALQELHEAASKIEGFLLDGSLDNRGK